MILPAGNGRQSKRMFKKSICYDQIVMSFDIPDEYEECIYPEEGELPDILYHVAPRSAREAIAKEGLYVDAARTHNTGGDYHPDYDDDWLYEDYGEGPIKAEWRPHGVYVWPTIDRALEYCVPGKTDLYEIETASISEIIRDPSVAMNWEYVDDNQAYVIEYADVDSICRVPGARLTALLAEVAIHQRPRLSDVGKEPEYEQLTIEGLDDASGHDL